MSAGRHTTLPGQHYCKAHQGNDSHYAEHNCTVCVLLNTLESLLAMVSNVLTDSQLDHTVCGGTIRNVIVPAETLIRRIRSC